MLLGGYLRRLLAKPTGQDDHVYAPDEAPEPADQHEGDREDLGHAHANVHGHCGYRSAVFTGETDATAAQYGHTADHGACGEGAGCQGGGV